MSSRLMERPTHIEFMEIKVILFCKPWSTLMGFVHLYGRQPWHPENRDQVETCRSLCIWTSNLRLSLAKCLAPGCKLEGQVVYDKHCFIALFKFTPHPSIRDDTLLDVPLKKKKRRRRQHLIQMIWRWLWWIYWVETPCLQGHRGISYHFLPLTHEGKNDRGSNVIYTNTLRLTGPHTTW